MQNHGFAIDPESLSEGWVFCMWREEEGGTRANRRRKRGEGT
jgi:hypothetical protein